MKAYIAGKLHKDEDLKSLAEIDKICKSLGLKTFLPRRDAGLCKDIKDVPKIFKGDITDGMKGIDLVIANLNGLHVGAGTAWELGYAYAKGIPAIGFKTDESAEEALDYLSAILVGSMPIVSSTEELKNKIKEILQPSIEE